jgi:SAM-dependent methyltransferase
VGAWILIMTSCQNQSTVERGERAETSGDEAGHGHGHGHGMGCHGAGASGDFSDAECFARMFDAPDRDGWQMPDDVVRLMAIAPGMTVADLGAGTGYFEARLAAAVGPEGHVLALDVEPSMIAYMQERFAREGLTNVEARQVPYDTAGLEPGSVDRILIVDTWHHVENRTAYAAALGAALRPGGTITIVDFTMESPHGPPAEMRLTPDAVIAELTSAGLTAARIEEPLPHQWIVRATLP